MVLKKIGKAPRNRFFVVSLMLSEQYFPRSPVEHPNKPKPSLVKYPYCFFHIYTIHRVSMEAGFS